MSAGEAIDALRSKLILIAEDAADVARRVQINDRDLRDRILCTAHTAETFARSAAFHLSDTVCADLASIETALELLTRLDDPGDEERSHDKRQVAKLARSMRTSIRDARDAAKSAGLLHIGDSGESEITLVPETERPLLDALVKRLDELLARLDALKVDMGSTPNQSPQQAALVDYVAHEMAQQVELAKLSLGSRDEIGFGTLARTITRIGELANDFLTTANQMRRAVTDAVRAHAQRVRAGATRVVGGLRTIVKARRWRAPATLQAHSSPSPEAQRVFICYRRDDTSYQTLLVASRLREVVPPDQVVLHDDNVPEGDFLTHLQKRIAECSLMLVMIGNRWLISSDRTERPRLFNRSDIVRQEIEAGLSRSIPIIPILFDDASMPSFSDLPESLGLLNNLNAFRIRHDSFQSDVDALVNLIKQGAFHAPI